MPQICINPSGLGNEPCAHGLNSKCRIVRGEELGAHLPGGGSADVAPLLPSGGVRGAHF